MKIGLLFPGQGAQKIGMGHEFYQSFRAARDVFAIISDTLKKDFKRLIFDGEPNELNLTENAQPALFCVSMAILNVILEQYKYQSLTDFAVVVAGHSLGEYSALTAAEVFSIEQGAQLLKIRGQAMQEACASDGAMAAILGLDRQVIEGMIQQISKPLVCNIANDNAPGQIVISGSSQAVEHIITIAQSEHKKRAIKLEVSGAFHSSLMGSAAVVMKQAMQNLEVKTPVVPVISNVTAREITANSLTSNDLLKNSIENSIKNPLDNHLADLLVRQICGSVRWRESIEYIAEKFNVDCLIEVGAGKVLTNLNKRIVPNTRALAINEPQDLEELNKLMVCSSLN